MLRLGYVAAGRRFGVILSIDGRGAVTLHFPSSPTGATALAGPGESLLPDAFELDDAPEFERFFLITADSPPAVDGVLAAARSLGASSHGAGVGLLELPPGLDQTSFLLRKVAP